MYHYPLLCIVDIDMTIADGSHRAHLVDGPVQDWQAFIHPENVAKDSVIPNAKECLHRLYSMGAHFVFLTGRNEGLRDVTTKWISQHLGQLFAEPERAATFTTSSIPPLVYPACMKYQLIMRPQGNEENASTYKERELTRVFIETKPTMLFAFDDDPYMWSVYERFRAIFFKAPDCWASLFPEAKNLAPEIAWRK